MMIGLHKELKAEGEESKDEWQKDTLKDIYVSLFDEFLDKIYGSGSKISQEDFVKGLKGEHSGMLNTLELRVTVLSLKS